eukprot:gene11979-13982_t
MRHLDAPVQVNDGSDDEDVAMNDAASNMRDRKKNKFRFQNFNDKISSIDINIFNKVGDQVIELTNDNDTYFYQTLTVWKELNKTLHFGKFVSNLGRAPATLPELLLLKDKVINIIKNHLSVPNTMALKPLLSILAALSRDLRSEFFADFYDILKILIGILKTTQVPESIEELFTSISFMFKFLERQIVADFMPFFERFASESMAFLLRKLAFEQLDDVLHAMFERVDGVEGQETVDAFSYLLFQIVKGVKGRFHSRCEHTLPLIFRCLDDATNTRLAIAKQMFILIKVHARNESDALLPIWSNFRKESAVLAKKLTSSGEEEDQEDIDRLGRQMTLFYTIIGDWISYRGGDRIRDVKEVLEILGQVMKRGAYTLIVSRGYDARPLTAAMSALLPHTTRVAETRDAFAVMVDVLFATADAAAQKNIFGFVLRLEREQVFEPFVWSRLVAYLERHARSLDHANTLAFVVRLVAIDGDQLTSLQEYRSLSQAPKLAKIVETALDAQVTDKISSIPSTWGALIATLCVDVEQSSILKRLSSTFDAIESRLAASKEDSHLIYVLGQCIVTRIIMTTRIAPTTLPSLRPVVLDLLERFPSNYYILNAASIYFESLLIQVPVKPTKVTKKNAATSTVVPHLDQATFTSLLPLFINNLSNKSNLIRKTTITLLSHLHQSTLGKSDKDIDIQRLLGYMLEIENAELHKIEGREVVVKMDSIVALYNAGKVGLLHTHLYHYMLGTFYIRYTPLWAATQRAIAQACKTDIAHFYPIFHAQMQATTKAMIGDRVPMIEDVPDQQVEEIEPENGPDTQETDESMALVEEDVEEEEQVEDEDDPMANMTMPSLFSQVMTISECNFDKDLAIRNILRSSTDVTAYNETLWKTLAMMGAVLEPYAKDIIDQFVDFVTIDYSRFSSAFARDDVAATRPPMGFSKGQAFGRLVAFLDYFAAFKRAPKMHRAEEVKALFARGIDVEEPRIQASSLNCLLLWKDPALTPYKRSLDRLIGDKSMRDEMTNFVIASTSPSCSIASDHRATVVDVVARILLTKLYRKTSARVSLDQQRSTLFAYMSGLTRTEITPLVHRITGPFAALLESVADDDVSFATLEAASDMLPNLDAQVSFLNVLGPFLKQLGIILVDAIPMLTKIVLGIAVGSCAALGKLKVASANSRANPSAVRSLSLKRMAAIAVQFENDDRINALLTVAFDVVGASLPTMVATGMSHGARDLILTVSSRARHVSLLSRDPNMMPKLLSFVAHAPLQSDILKLVENLFLGDEPVFLQVIKPHINDFIAGVQASVAASKNTRLSKRVLIVLAEVSPHATDAAQADSLLALLLKFFSRSRTSLQGRAKADEDLVLSMLQIVKNMVALVNDPAPHVAPLSALFDLLISREPRLLLCQIFKAIGTKIPSIAAIAKQLKDLNSYSAKSLINSYDFARRLAAFSTLNEQLPSLTEAPLQALMYNYIYYINDVDFSIRNSASTGLYRLATHAFAGTSDAMDTSTKPDYEKLFRTIVVPAIRRACPEGTPARDEFLTLLTVLIKSELFFPDMKVLLGNNEDKNFFIAFTHIQKARKRIAFNMLRDILVNNKMRTSSITQILFPLTMATLLETSKKEGPMLGEVAKVIADLAAQLDWRNYYLMTRTLIKAMEKHPLKQKYLLRSLCDVLDNFHFFIDPSQVDKSVMANDMNTASIELVAKEEDEEDATRDDDDLVVDDDSIMKSDVMEEGNMLMVVNVKDKQAARTISEDMHLTIVNILVPALEKHLLVRQRVGQDKSAAKENVVDITVALAIFKLYHLLPEEASNNLYPPLIGKIVNELKNKSQSMRDSARDTLVKVLDTLGVRFFKFIQQDLRNVLKSGYQKHVLVYTIHALLLSMERAHVEPGVLDATAKTTMDIIVDYLFIDVSIPKDAVHKDSYTETKQPRVFDALKVMTSLTHFANIPQYIMQPIEDIIGESNSPKLVPHLEEMIKKIAKGIQANTSVTPKDLLVFIFNCFAKGVSQRTDPNKVVKKNPDLKPTYEETFTIQADPSKKRAEPIKQWESNSFLFTQLALNLLIAVVKKKDSIKGIEYLQMIDPLVPTLIKCMEHKQSKIVHLSIRALKYIFDLELPTLKDNLKDITTLILKRLQKDSGHEKIVKGCFEIAIHILRDPKNTLVSEVQLRVILSITKQLFLDSEIKLTRAITMLHNLSYESEEGRLAVLRMLAQVTERFPREVLNKYALILFVPLVVRLSNDPSLVCRGEVSNVISNLVKGVGPAQATQIFDMTLLWFTKTENAMMSKTAAQLIGTYAASFPGFASHIDRILPVAIAHLTTGLEVLAKAEQDSNVMLSLGDEDAETIQSNAVLPGWQIVYHVFVAFEAIFKEHSTLIESSSMRVLWSRAMDYLNYPHIWVRTSVARLYGIYFSSQKSDVLVPLVDRLHARSGGKVPATVTTTVFGAANLWNMTKKMCSIFNSRLVTEELGMQLVKNLIFLSMLFYRCKNVRPLEDNATKDDSTTTTAVVTEEEGGEAQEEESDTFGWGYDEVLKNVKTSIKDSTSRDDDQHEIATTTTAGDDDEQHQMLLWLFKRLSYMSTKMGLLRRKFIFRWMGAMSTQMTQAELTPYLPIILIPLAKVVDVRVNTSPEEKQLANEVISLIKNKVGGSRFSMIFKEIETVTQQLRHQRRQAEKIAAVANPKEYLLKKAERRKTQKEAKKRKVGTSYGELTDDKMRIKVSRKLLDSFDNQDDD